MIRLSDLPEKSQAELLRRVRALGLSPRLWENPFEPPNSFHREGVGWHAGEFLYRASAEVHGLAHEVGHVAQLPPGEWNTLRAAYVKTSEFVAAILQVELSRGIAGLGAYRMLQEMQEAGYSFFGEGEREIGLLQWWRRVPYHLRAELATANAIAEHWK